MHNAYAYDFVMTSTASEVAAELERLWYQVDSQPKDAERLRNALIEVMDWIDAWDPNFIEAEGWGETKAKVISALRESAHRGKQDED